MSTNLNLNISLTLEQLQNPSVTRALSQLMLAMGSDADSLPIDISQLAESGELLESGGRRKRAYRKKTRQAAPKTVAPTHKVPKIKVSTPLAPEEQAFFDQLSEGSQAIGLLLREKGTLTMEEAKKEFNVENGKVIGGIIGAIARRAPKNNFKPLYTTSSDETGMKVWRWQGFRPLNEAPDNHPPKKAKRVIRRRKKS